jgi:hypothetical protein
MCIRLCVHLSVLLGSAEAQTGRPATAVLKHKLRGFKAQDVSCHRVPHHNVDQCCLLLSGRNTTASKSRGGVLGHTESKSRRPEHATDICYKRHACATAPGGIASSRGNRPGANQHMTKAVVIIRGHALLSRYFQGHQRGGRRASHRRRSSAGGTLHRCILTMCRGCFAADTVRRTSAE